MNSVFRTFGVLAFAVLASFGASWAQDNQGIELLSALDYWQNADDIQIVGNVAYVVSGVSGLHIMDISDPIHPSELGRCTWYDWIDVTGGVCVTGNRAYVATAGGIRVYDVADPTQPELIGEHGLGNMWGWGDIDVYGDLAVLLNDGVYPSLWDFSNLADIHQVGEFAGIEWPTKPLGMVGGLLCMGGRGLTVWDVGNPSAPALLAAVDTNFYARSVALQGNHAFLASIYDGVHVYDLSNPLAPALIGSCDSAYSVGVAVVGNHALVNKGWGFNLWNVADPAQPMYTGAHVGQVRWGDNALAGTGSTVFVSTFGRDSAVAVVDISSPAAPAEVAAFGRQGYLHRFAVDGDIAYVAGSWAGLRTVSFADPGTAEELAIATGSLASATWDIALNGGHAFSANLSDGIQVWDVGDPLAPESLTTVQGSTLTARRIKIGGNHAYVIDGDGGWLHTFRFQSPESLVQVNYMQIEGAFYSGFELADGYLYLAAGLHFYVYSLADPAAPALVGQCGLPFYWGAYPNDMTVANGCAYVADVVGGVRIIGVSNPEAPAEIGFLGETVWTITSSGTTLVTNGVNGIRLWDIATPGSPALIGYYTTNEWLEDMVVVGPHLLTTSGSQFRVYACDALAARTAPEPTPTSFALEANYPNPFNASTEIRFDLPRASRVTLSVYNGLGQRVATLLDAERPAGSHRVRWHAPALPSGTYVCRMQASSFADTKKMILVR